MELRDYLPESNIILNLTGKTKLEVIKELLQKMYKLQLVNDYDNALDDVLAREGHLSTGLENGVAIPHAKTDGVTDLAIVFGVKKSGVEFETLDGKPANFIFLVLSPKNTSGPHIQALALISRNLKLKETRDKLLNSKSEAEIAKIFKSF